MILPARAKARRWAQSLPRLDRRLILLLAASIIIPAVLLTVVAIQYRRDLERDARVDALSIARLMREEVSGLIQARSVLLSRIEEHLGGQDWNAIGGSSDLPTYLAVVAKQSGSADSILLIDPEGQVRSASFPLAGHPLNYADRDFVNPGPTGNDIMVSRLHPDLGIEGWGFAIAKRRSIGGGTIVIGASIEPLFGFYRELLEKPGETAALVDQSGRLIVRFPPLPGNQPLPTPPPGFLSAIRGSREGIYDGLSRLTQEPRFVAFADVPGTGLYVAFGHGLDEIRAGWERSIFGFTLASLPAALGLVIVSVIVMGQVGQERRTAQRLAEAQEQLRQAQKMEALGRLTGGVAHDFNNLLTVIGGNVALLHGAVGDPDRSGRLLDAVERAVERATAMTRHLLAFARRQPLEPRPIDLNELIRDLLELLVRSLPPNIQVATDLEGRLWPVQVDPGQLETAILNVAVNARDAMPDGGTLQFRTRKEPTEGKVLLEISDTGTGMAPEVAAQVFEPFFTTKPPGRGTGLGLSQVYGFIQQSGGQIGLESQPDIGTTIRLVLPRASGPVVPRLRSSEPGRPSLSKAEGRILLIEDEEAVALVTAGILEKAGYTVTRVSGRSPAFDAVDEGADLILSDIVIGAGEDGISLARSFRTAWPDLPILLTSGSSEALMAARLAGFPVIAKPFGERELLDAVQRVRQASSPATALSPRQAIG
jgi:two-component system NtrC family sensor kinase